MVIWVAAVKVTNGGVNDVWGSVKVVKDTKEFKGMLESLGTWI